MEFSDNKAIYLQITEYVHENILAGKWRADERVPSVRDLAVELQVNPNTVMRAYDQLQAGDILYNKRGIGLHVSADAVTLITAKNREIFLNSELPAFFRKMDLLQITPEEIMRLHKLRSEG